MSNNFKKEAHIRGAFDSISLEQIRKIDCQMTFCICNIIHNNITGTGFFCRIPFPDNYSLLPVLITCNHVLDEKSISKGKRINFILDDKYYSLLIDESRKKYTDKIKDITFIEIKRSDNLQNISFLDLDENFNLNGQEDEKSIYVLHFEFGKNTKFSPGIIVYIKKSKKGFYKIMYSCSTETGSSGGPIINSSNSKVIGIHRGFWEKHGLNLGMIIEVPKDFYNYYKNLDNVEKEYNILNDYSEYYFKEENEIIKNLEKKENEIIHNQIKYEKYENNLIKNTQIHEHPFDFYEEINDQCNICLQKIENAPAYKCDDCKIISCLDCTSKIFYEKNMNIPHQHPLKLTTIKNWTCDICSFNYINKCICFYCHQCDFCACSFCYLDGNNKSGKLMFENNKKIHKHPLYYKEELSTQCTFCNKKIKNKEGYECKECSITLCLECDLIIFHKKKSYIHQHNLKLKNRLHFKCDICMNDYYFQTSCACNKCNFDICHKCYYNSLNN